MAKKKKKSSASKVRLMTFGTLSVVLVFIFFITLFSNLYTLYKVEEEKIKKENEYAVLQDKTDELKTEIIKLKDPEYLAKFARENYSYSKKDEIIIKIDKKEKEVEKENSKALTSTSDFHGEWIIFACVVGFILILAYAFIKSRYKTKEQ